MMNGSMLKIFLVDEDYIQQQALRRILEAAGQSNIITFEDELECLQHLYQKPDLIFLDHNLSTFTGYAVIRKIKLLHPKALVVIVSAKEDIQIIADSIKYGALDYIKKTENLELQVKRFFKNISVMNKVGRSVNQAPPFIKNIFNLFLAPPKYLKTT